MQFIVVLMITWDKYWFDGRCIKYMPIFTYRRPVYSETYTGMLTKPSSRRSKLFFLIIDWIDEKWNIGVCIFDCIVTWFGFPDCLLSKLLLCYTYLILLALTVTVSLVECYQPKDKGSGDLWLMRYYYNWREQKCLRFIYKGSGGNTNRFETKEECNRRCVL